MTYKTGQAPLQEHSVPYDRLLEILHRYVDTDWNEFGNSEPIYRILTEECGCTYNELMYLGFDWMPQVQSEWCLTDDDCYQMVRRVAEDTFELYQITEVSEAYGISHDLIDVRELSDEEIQSTCGCYDYKDMTAICAEYGVSATQILAECRFELDALDNLLSVRYPTWENAKEAICKLTGSVQAKQKYEEEKANYNKED